MKQKIENEIIKYFPEKIRIEINKLNIENFEEIRLRVLKPIIIKEHDKETILASDGQVYILAKEELNKIFEMICNNSIYAFQELKKELQGITPCSFILFKLICKLCIVTCNGCAVNEVSCSKLNSIVVYTAVITCTAITDAEVIGLSV